MKKEEIIELANKVYKLTLLFPKKEPLRYKIRELADKVLANFTSLEALKDSNPGSLAANWERRYKDLIFLIERDSEIIYGFFEIAKWQKWVSYFDILEIKEKYDKIKNYFKKEAEDFLRQEKTRVLPGFDKATENQIYEIEKIEISENEKQISLDSRKEKILKILEEKGKAQVWEIKEIFPGVSKRTLRRDFEKLLKQGIIERRGERNKTFYQLMK